MSPELDADAPQNQQPEDDRERQIEAAERRGVEQREREIERAASRNQPHLVSVPHGPDRSQDRLALGVVGGDDQMQDTRADVETVEDDVGREHAGDKTEPNRL